MRTQHSRDLIKYIPRRNKACCVLSNSRVEFAGCFDAETMLRGYGAPYELKSIAASEFNTLNMTEVCNDFYRLIRMTEVAG